MNLTQLPPPMDDPPSGGQANALRDGLRPSTAPDEAVELRRWQALLAQVGRDLAEPLTAALERVTILNTTGRIDRHGLRALRDEIDRARQAGLLCQQMSRLASGRIRQSQERVHLTHTLQSVLAYRVREMHANGIQLRQSLQPAELRVDASMLFALLNTLLDWAIPATHGVLDLNLTVEAWPEQARLQCRIRHHPSDQPALTDLPAISERLNSLHWHLFDQTARTLGLRLRRQVSGTHATVSVDFPTTITATLEDVRHEPNDGDFVDSINSKPLAGSHVLVMSQRRDLRVQVRECLKSMGLVLDFVASVNEAAAFCSEGLPHALVFEGALRSPRLEQLMADIRREVPELVFIEMLDEGRSFDISTVSDTGMARIGRDAISTSLPSALVYELSRVM